MAILLCFTGYKISAQHTHSKVADNIFNSSINGMYDYIVVLKNQADVSSARDIHGKENKASYVFQKLKDQSDKSQKNIVNYCKQNNLKYQSFYLINALQIYSPIEDVLYLASLDEVRFIYNNSPMRMLDGEMDRSQPSVVSRDVIPEWGIRMIKADSVWRLGYNGQGVVVGGQDTGYSWEVNPLKNKYRGWDGTVVDHNYNWHDAIHEKHFLNFDSLNPCGYSIRVPCDDSNHGTHTMGTMVGEDEENKIGVAPGARWVGCRNMERGWGKPSTYIECFEWFVAPTDTLGLNPDPSKGPHVIANSWGCPPEEGCDTTNFSLMENAVINLKAAGTVVVVSAGNDGPRCESIENPASIFEASFTVGATRSNDTLWNGSSRGLVTVDHSNRMKPNVTAPGANVRSVVKDGSFSNYTGTSMAGPHVVGLVALMISANPKLAGEVDAIEDIIEASAVPKFHDTECSGISDVIPNPVYGYGRVDALRAVELSLQWINTGVSENDGNVKAIYPNPTTGLVNVELSTEHPSSWQVFNISGRLIKSGMAPSYGIFDVNFSDQENGMYILVVNNEKSIQATKIIVSH